MKQEMSEMEMNISQQISYLKRHKVSHTYSSCCILLNRIVHLIRYLVYKSSYHNVFHVHN